MTNSSVADGGEDESGDQAPLPSRAVVEAVAEESETDPTDLPSLYEAIDPTALDELFADRAKGEVTFDCCGYEVTVERNGEIAIHPE